MAKSVFDAPQFKTEEGAFAYVEAHLWPNGPVCPHCGNCDQTRIRKMEGKTTRMGLRKCNECRKPFTVRMGTIFESSHLALHLWLQVIHLMCASKKGISTRQIQRMLQCSMKTAWFLTHRIREAMRAGELAVPFGSGGGTCQYLEQEQAIESGGPSNGNGAKSDLPDDEADELSDTFGGAKVGDFIQWESQGVLQMEKPMRVRLVSDDGQWVAVEGSETGIPMSEVIVQERVAAPPPPPPMFKLASETPEQPRDGETEWISNIVGRGRKVRLLVSGGDMGPKEISKLILLLQAQKAVLDDDDQEDEA